MSDRTLYTADWVLPISSAPIRHGAVLVQAGRIAFVGAASAVTVTPGAEIDGWVEVPNDVVQKGDQVAMTQLGMLTNGTKVRK